VAGVRVIGMGGCGGGRDRDGDKGGEGTVGRRVGIGRKKGNRCVEEEREMGMGQGTWRRGRGSGGRGKQRNGAGV
jgi:hypothetical protein